MTQDVNYNAKMAGILFINFVFQIVIKIMK
jgi:hypothetical protein